MDTIVFLIWYNITHEVILHRIRIKAFLNMFTTHSTAWYLGIISVMTCPISSMKAISLLTPPIIDNHMVLHRAKPEILLSSRLYIANENIIYIYICTAIKQSSKIRITITATKQSRGGLELKCAEYIPVIVKPSKEFFRCEVIITRHPVSIRPDEIRLICVNQLV